MKLVVAYWPSTWQAATEDRTTVDLFFGVFSSMKVATEAICANLSNEEWSRYKNEFIYEEVEVDAYHPIPKIE